MDEEEEEDEVLGSGALSDCLMEEVDEDSIVAVVGLSGLEEVGMVAEDWLVLLRF